MCLVPQKRHVRPVQSERSSTSNFHLVVHHRPGAILSVCNVHFMFPTFDGFQFTKCDYLNSDDEQTFLLSEQTSSNVDNSRLFARSAGVCGLSCWAVVLFTGRPRRCVVLTWFFIALTCCWKHSVNENSGHIFRNAGFGFMHCCE